MKEGGGQGGSSGHVYSTHTDILTYCTLKMLVQDCYFPSVPTYVLTTLLTFILPVTIPSQQGTQNNQLSLISKLSASLDCDCEKLWAALKGLRNPCQSTHLWTCCCLFTAWLTWSHYVESRRRLQTKQMFDFVPIKNCNTTDSIVLYVVDSGLQWEKQADSKWILIFPAVHYRWFLAEWLHSCRVVRGWTV